MHLLSINLGVAHAVDPTRPHDLTGIYKEPVAGPVQVTAKACPATQSSAGGITAGRTRRSTSTAARTTPGGRPSWGVRSRPARSART